MSTITQTCTIASFLLWSGIALAIDQPSQVSNDIVETTSTDIFEPINRVIFGFNHNFANYVVIPTAGILDQITPGWLKQAGSNFYENLTEPEFMFTNLVEGYPKDSAISVARLAVNSTVGIAGIFDVATTIGLKRRQIEVSESFCNAGIPPGPYVVFPLVGPTNLLSGGLMTALLATEWYLLSFIDYAVAAGDAILDTTVAAASLRHINDIPKPGNVDSYIRQQNDYWNELRTECPSAFTKDPAPTAVSAKQ